MTTQEKIKIVLNLIDSMQFSEEEKIPLLKSLMAKWETPILDWLEENKQKISEIIVKAINETFSAETELALKKNPKKNKANSESKEKPVTLTKSGKPRKPYTRRTKENVSEMPTVAVSETKTEEPIVKETEEVPQTEQDSSENMENTEIEALKEKILYQNPNNPKALIVSDKILPEGKVLGIVVKYPNKKSVFGVSLYEEKQLMTEKTALAKARTFPKFFGNSWEILTEKHQAALLASQSKINKLLKKLHGDPVHGRYLTAPFAGKHSLTAVRFAIELPDVSLDE